MNYSSAWVYTCGILCIYPALAFLAGVWYAKNSTRINWKFWRRDDR